jgi:predicted outer membrane repeat protein
VTIDDSTVSANTAAVDGGGILMQGAVLTVRNGSLLGGDTEAEGNKATNDGGAIFAQGTSVTIDGSTVSRNSAEDKGGAVFLASSTVGSSLFVNSTFSSNSAGDRAGGLNIESPTVIRNSTITGNRADSDGDGTGARGGIFTIADRLTMHNTIVAGNFKGTGTTPSDLDSGTSLVAGSSHNLIGSADGGTGGLVDGTDGNIVGVNGAGTRDINTILDTTLADNGGPTLTHALVFGSPTVDGGDNAQALDPSGSTLLTDQRQAGFDRFFDGIGNGTDTVDIGAFEADRDLVAPNVEAIVINGGDSQRSMVREITVNFSEIVNVDSSTLMVENLDTTVCYVPEVTRQAVDGKTIATLTFSGTDIVGGSLPDGNYRLTMLDTITDGGGTQLDGDADGAPGGNATDEFFRLYGDATGDGSVDIFDLLQFRTTYNTQNGDSNFNEAFDFGGDGNINVFDLLQFRTRYRTSV